MPYFIDLFIQDIRSKRNYIRNILAEHSDTFLKEMLDEFKSIWNPLPRKDYFDFNAIAIDSSRAISEIFDGAIFHVCRAMGLTNNGKVYRDLETEIFYYCSRDEELASYLSMRLEYLEWKIVKKYLSDIKDKGDSINVILIDGSLYGRIMHIPKDSPLESNRDFMLKYMDLYTNIIDECRRKNVWIIGVSKDSKTDLLRKIILTRVFEKYVSQNIWDKDIRDKMYKFWRKMFRTPFSTLKRLQEFFRNNPSIPSEILNIFREHVKQKPDIHMIKIFTNGLSGYTTPIELGAGIYGTRAIFSGKIDIEKYLMKNFKKCLYEMGSKAFKKYALDILYRVLNFPTIISLYATFKDGDLPLKIDFPSWMLNIDRKIPEAEPYRFIDKDDENIHKILSILYSLYGGERNYNVLLKRVDEKVKLTNKIMTQIYENVLQKELNIVITHMRGFRRVIYP